MKRFSCNAIPRVLSALMVISVPAFLFLPPPSTYASGEPDSLDPQLNLDQMQWSEPVRLGAELDLGSYLRFSMLPANSGRLYCFLQGARSPMRLRNAVLSIFNDDGELGVDNIMHFTSATRNVLYESSDSTLYNVLLNRLGFGAYEFSEGGDIRPDQWPVHEIGTGPAGFFTFSIITDPNGYPIVWYSVDFTAHWTRTSLDFTEIIDEGDIEITHPNLVSGDISVGPGDTLHMAYSRIVFDDNNVQNVIMYYTKLDYDGNLLMDPVAYTDTTQDGGWMGRVSERFQDDGCGLVIDKNGNVYILHIRDGPEMAENYLYLKVISPDGMYSSMPVELHYSSAGQRCAIVKDALDRVHIVYANRDSLGFRHGIVNRGHASWLQEPRQVLNNDWDAISLFTLVSYPDRLRLALLYTVYNDETYEEEAWFQFLSVPAEPDIHHQDAGFLIVSDSSTVGKQEQALPYPNPFNSSINIPFTLSEPALVNLSLYNILGKKISTLHRDYYSTGDFIYHWNSHAFSASSLSSGNYFICVEHNGLKQFLPVTFVK